MNTYNLKVIYTSIWITITFISLSLFVTSKGIIAFLAAANRIIFLFNVLKARPVISP
jgi:hypothetical protein